MAAPLLPPLYLFQRRHHRRVFTKNSQGELQRLPHLVAEVSAGEDLRDGQTDVLSWSRDKQISVSRRSGINSFSVSNWRFSSPCTLWEQRANLNASVPHWGIPLGKSFFCEEAKIKSIRKQPCYSQLYWSRRAHLCFHGYQLLPGVQISFLHFVLKSLRGDGKWKVKTWGIFDKSSVLNRTEI